MKEIKKKIVFVRLYNKNQQILIRLGYRDSAVHYLYTIGVAPITQLPTWVIKIVTFKGCHLMWQK